MAKSGIGSKEQDRSNHRIIWRWDLVFTAVSLLFTRYTNAEVSLNSAVSSVVDGNLWTTLYFNRWSGTFEYQTTIQRGA